MSMGKNKIVFIEIFFDELIAESPNSGSGIYNDYISAIGPDFNARGISAIFQIILSGNRNRPSGPPGLDIHYDSLS
jgi:hypothetical protein